MQVRSYYPCAINEKEFILYYIAALNGLSIYLQVFACVCVSVQESGYEAFLKAGSYLPVSAAWSSPKK